MSAVQAEHNSSFVFMLLFLAPSMQLCVGLTVSGRILMAARLPMTEQHGCLKTAVSRARFIAEPSICFSKHGNSYVHMQQ